MHKLSKQRRYHSERGDLCRLTHNIEIGGER